MHARVETVIIYIRHRVEKSELHISKLTSAKISYFLHSHPFLRVSLLKSHPHAYSHLLSISLTFPLAFQCVGSSFVPRLEASIPDILTLPSHLSCSRLSRPVAPQLSCLPFLALAFSSLSIPLSE